MDISKITEEIELNRERAANATLADEFDFDLLRAINRDSDQEPINAQLESFLDWSESFLRRMPANWQDYLNQTPADLKGMVDDSKSILANLHEAGNEKMGARGSRLSGLSSQVQSVMGRTVNSLRELLFLQMIGDDRSSATKPVLDRIRRSEEGMATALTSAESHESKLAEMAAASQEVTAKIAASGRARIFHNDGQSYQCAAKRWLIVTTILGTFLIVLAFGMSLGWFLSLPSDATNAQTTGHFFGKLLILATVGAAVTFSGRQYAANRHNAVQNFHRSSALRTYRALLAASRDEAVHDVMLNHAAQAIFVPSDTGYSKSGANNEQAPMVQLFQGMGRNSEAP